MDRLQTMEIFTKVAEAGSFSRAAEHLQLPKPTVTIAVQALEARLRVRLFERTTRKVALTAEGAAYYERCVDLLSDIDSAEAMFSESGRGLHGTVRVDLPERFAQMTIIPALPQFFARYPDLRIILNASDRFTDLLDAGVDCVLRVGELADSSLVVRKLGQLHQVNCASPGYLARYGTPQTPADLADHRAVAFASSRLNRDYDFEYLEDGQIRRVPMPSHISVSSANAYVTACIAGLGIIQGPHHGLEEMIASGQICMILDDYVPPSLPVSVLLPSARHLAPRVRSFVDWMSGLIAGSIR